MDEAVGQVPRTPSEGKAQTVVRMTDPAARKDENFILSCDRSQILFPERSDGERSDGGKTQYISGLMFDQIK